MLLCADLGWSAPGAAQSPGIQSRKQFRAASVEAGLAEEGSQAWSIHKVVLFFITSHCSFSVLLMLLTAGTFRV